MSELGVFTASEFQYLSHILQKLFELDGIIFWPDVERIIVEFFPCQENLRKGFFRYFDIYIAIIRFEEVVIFRLMLFDQIIFKIERFALVFYGKKIDFIRFFQHLLFSERVGCKVLSEPFLEIFCFSDIQNSSFSVFEQVNSGIDWNFADIGGEHEEEFRI